MRQRLQIYFTFPKLRLILYFRFFFFSLFLMGEVS